MSSSERQKPPVKIAGDRFKMEKRLGAGCFGEVWLGHDKDANRQVAVKFESTQGHALQLEQEVEVLNAVARGGLPQGFVECYHWGREGRFNCLVMELLGKSLEDMVQICKGRFSVPTVLLCAEQILCRIEYLHSKGFIHRDIKPENFMFGIGEKAHHIYLIDFGLSKKYWDVKHTPMRHRLNMTGTARYASINAHKGDEQSRRDDLEAIGHMLLYFLRGALPWSGLDAKTQEEKYRKIREKKEQTPLEDLCKGFPDAFQKYLASARSLEFQERPDYNGYRKSFRDVRSRYYADLQDHEYQWNESKELGRIVPLTQWKSPKQPDEDAAAKSGSTSCFSFCCSKPSARD